MDAFLERFRCGFAAAMPGEKWDMFSGLQSRCGVTRAEPASVIDDFPTGKPTSEGLPQIPEGSERVIKDQGAVAEASGAADDTVRTDTSRSSDMASQEREREKIRLQRLLKDFAKECVAGVPINLVNTRIGRLQPYFFQMDRRLAFFSLRPSDGYSFENVVEEFSLREVETIFKGEEVFNRAPFLGLDAGSCVGIDMIDGSKRSLVLHFDDAYERDKFYTSLQVLKMSIDIQQAK